MKKITAILLAIMLFNTAFAQSTKNDNDDVYNSRPAKEEQVSAKDTSALTVNGQPATMSQKGKIDARNHYEKYHGASTGTLITTALGGVFGLIPGIACSVTPPEDKRLGVPNPLLMKNVEYDAAYRKEAWRIKRKKVLIGFAEGAAIDVLVILALSIH